MNCLYCTLSIRLGMNNLGINLGCILSNYSYLYLGISLRLLGIVNNFRYLVRSYEIYRITGRQWGQCNLSIPHCKPRIDYYYLASTHHYNSSKKSDFSTNYKNQVSKTNIEHYYSRTNQHYKSDMQSNLHKQNNNQVSKHDTNNLNYSENILLFDCIHGIGWEMSS